MKISWRNISANLFSNMDISIPLIIFLKSVIWKYCSRESYMAKRFRK